MNDKYHPHYQGFDENYPTQLKRKKRPAAKTSITQRSKLWARCGGKCEYCKESITYSKQSSTSDNYFTVDHVVSLSKGGENRFKNKAAVCRRCNTWKSDGTLEKLILKLKKKGILK